MTLQASILQQLGQVISFGLEGFQVVPLVTRSKVASTLYAMEKQGLVRRTKRHRGQVTWFLA
jgi:hypothetical protein